VPSASGTPHGPEEDAVDQNELVKELNDDLSSEFRSIVQYVQHIATIKGAEYLSTVAELEAHVAQELRHALVLAQQVEFLGGVPTTVVPDVPSSADSREALSLDLELEQSQLQRYRDRTEQAVGMGLPDVAEALRPLLEQTQEHVRDLQTVLDV
jgi:bacterioferritin